MSESRRAPTRRPLQLGRLVAALLPFVPQLSFGSEVDAIVLYAAFGSEGAAVVEGRIIERKSSPEPAPGDGARSNLLRNLWLLINDERADRALSLRIGERVFEAVTDAEGYFRVEIAGLETSPRGWHPVLATSRDASAEGALLLVPDANVHGIISDLDDTILVSEVTHRRRMLARTFLSNPLQREIVAGTPEVYRTLAARNAEPDSAPLFYLSGSPRQFHASIQAFLQHNAFPRGVLITKRLTDDATSERLRDQVAYKTARIADILARLPAVRFTLIGDDGERDPEIYAEVQRLHPDRIDAIWIRRVHPDPARPRLPGQADLAELLRETRSAPDRAPGPSAQ